MPYDLTFTGNFFHVADFINGNRLTGPLRRLEARGRWTPDDHQRLLPGEEPKQRLPGHLIANFSVDDLPDPSQPGDPGATDRRAAPRDRAPRRKSQKAPRPQA